MTESDFDWVKRRIDDLARKWADEKARDWKNFKIARDALNEIMQVERDEKGNHYTVIRSLACDALQRLDW